MSGFVDPSRDQLKEMASLNDDGPVQMLNLIRLRKKAKYEDKREASGAQAYSDYARESEAFFKGVGGRIVFAGHARLTVIGPEDERWDLVFVAEYPSAKSFADMIANPGYQSIVHHRRAAVKDSRLIRLRPGDPARLLG